MKYFKPIRNEMDIVQMKEDLREISFNLLESGKDKKGRTMFRLKKNEVTLGIIVLMNMKLLSYLEEALLPLGRAS